MKARKHAEWIKKWADGAEIQCQLIGGAWVDEYPLWSDKCVYRVKPEEPEWMPKEGDLILVSDDGYHWGSDIFESFSATIQLRFRCKTECWKNAKPHPTQIKLDKCLGLLREAQERFREYGMDVDDLAPWGHVDFMERLNAALK